MPSRIGATADGERIFETRNFLFDDASECRGACGAHVVIVIDGDQRALFEDQLVSKGNPLDYSLLVVPDRRGIPFARHTAKTLADLLELQIIFFRDDDIILYLHDKDTKNVRLPLPAGIQKLRDVHQTARLKRDASTEQFSPAVVGCSSFRHKKNLNGYIAEGHSWSYSKAIDFRFVLIDLTACRDLSFINEAAREMTKRQWESARKKRSTNADPQHAIQISLFQGEDFGFCEQLAAVHKYKQTVQVNYVFAGSVSERQQGSAAGTVKTRHVPVKELEAAMDDRRWSFEPESEFAPAAVRTPVAWHNPSPRPGRIPTLHSKHSCGNAKNMKPIYDMPTDTSFNTCKRCTWRGVTANTKV